MSRNVSLSNLCALNLKKARAKKSMIVEANMKVPARKNKLLFPIKIGDQSKRKKNKVARISDAKYI